MKHLLTLFFFGFFAPSVFASPFSASFSVSQQDTFTQSVSLLYSVSPTYSLGGLLGYHDKLATQDKNGYDLGLALQVNRPVNDSFRFQTLVAAGKATYDEKSLNFLQIEPALLVREKVLEVGLGVGFRLNQGSSQKELQLAKRLLYPQLVLGLDF
jgi:hypothetical protein